MHKVEFSDGTIVKVITKMTSKTFHALQEQYKIPIVKIDGKPAAYFNMSKKDIKKEKKRIKLEKDILDVHLQYQANCKHNRGLITNTGFGVGSRCALCGKEIT